MKVTHPSGLVGGDSGAQCKEPNPAGAKWAGPDGSISILAKHK